MSLPPKVVSMRFTISPTLTISGILKNELESIMSALKFVGLLDLINNVRCNIVVSKTAINEFLGSFETPTEDDDSCFIYVKRRNYSKHDGTWLSTLVHELMHLKQFTLGTLTDAMIASQGALDASVTSYLTLAHEVEARRAEFAYRKDVQGEEILEDNYFIKSYKACGAPLL